MSFPYLAKSTIKYKSPHATDLSFAKDEKIRVTGPSDDDEDWLVGESLDGSRSGGFPKVGWKKSSAPSSQADVKDFVIPIEEEDEAPAEAAPPASAPAPATIPVVDTESAPPVPVDESPPPSPRLEPSSLPQSPLPVPSPAPVQAPSALSTKVPTSTPGPAAAPRSPAPVSAASTVGESDAPDPSQMTMKDRLAFFAAAQGKAGPPPPIKPKPATGGLTWSQRQKLRQEEDAKAQQAGTALDSPTSAPAPTPAPAADISPAQVSPTSPKQEKKEGTGMSAADAQTSIGKGGSLKERMAALQGAGAFGQSDETTKPAPPAPSGKVWKRPPAPERDPESDGEEGTVRSPTAEDGDGLAEAGDQEVEEKTEEEEEKARKAAIAARMAKLGSRGPMAMALPPKPARKPTRESVTSVSPTVEKSSIESEALAVTKSETEAPASPTTTSPPTSVPMPAIARRTAPPRRRGPPSSNAVPTVLSTSVQPGVAAEKDESLSIGPNNGHEPPPQVMVYDEEKPLPKTEEEKAREKEYEEAGSKHGGADGAAAAGIALAPAHDQSDREVKDSNDGNANEDQDVKAQSGELGLKSPVKQPEMVPLHSPAESPMVDDDETPPPPPPRMSMSDLPKDEIEMKHQHEDAEAEAEREDDVQDEGDEEEDEAPPPPQRDVRRSLGGGGKPLGPRPLPSPGKVGVAPPLPPLGNAVVPPRADSEDEIEAEDEEDEEEAPPPPPPARKPSAPVPARLQMPPVESPSTQSPASPQMMQSFAPDSPRSPMRAPPLSPNEDSAAEGDDDEASRRSGIAARMAKLGGVKFGAPPVPKTKRTMSTEPSSTIDETPKSPIRENPPTPLEDGGAEEVVPPSSAAGGDDDADETPEQEAARRRATLARLRAGGSLGFGMFGQRGSTASPATADTDDRGLETQSEEAEDEVPPVPSGRPVPLPQQTPSIPNVEDDDVEEEEGADAPPPPPARPGATHSRSATAQSADFAAPPPPSRAVPPPIATDEDEMDDAPPPPARPAQSPPVPQSPSGRPAVPPAERRSSQMLSRASMDQPPPPPPPPIERQVTEEPAEFAPPPPARPAQIVTQMQSPPASPRRSTSIASRSSGHPGMTPASRQGSRMDESLPRASLSQNRPGFNELQEASRVQGTQLIRAAKAMFSQGKQAHYGDGSSAGFVLTALDNAKMPRPQDAWGYVIMEQEASSVLKRSDEPRPGDIAAFYDAKFKGKKGLSSYTQNVGSVEEPLVGVVSESETKKHKLRVLQVERGVPEEVSYRCDDLKSGRVVVFRPGV